MSNETMIRAITLWQPYASLVACGAKQYETRHWKTDYRGDLVIHAAAKRDFEIWQYCSLPQVSAVLAQHGITRKEHLIFGAALCVVTLTDCVPTECIPQVERVLGDYSANRYAWKLENVRLFVKPIPCAGAQGLWTWEKPIPAPQPEPVAAPVQLAMFNDEQLPRRVRYD
jgi:hypothetical protein